MQYIYWEKVKPEINGVPFDPTKSLYPLMRNWTEATASVRDMYDFDNGRGLGIVSAKIFHASFYAEFYVSFRCSQSLVELCSYLMQIDDCITEEHRNQLKVNTPDVASKLKGKVGKHGNGDKKAGYPRASPAVNLLMETILKRMMDHIDTKVFDVVDKKIAGVSDECAKVRRTKWSLHFFRHMVPLLRM